MPTHLIRVLGGLDPDDPLAPVLVDLEQNLEVGQVFPKAGEGCRFRTSDGKPLQVEESLQLRCLKKLESGYYGPMYLAELA